MTRTKKVLGVLLILIAAGVLTLGIAISRNAPCEPVPALARNATPMKAIVHTCYGPPEVLSFVDIAKPTPADDEVLVKVHAASVNPLDWHYLRGEPYIMRMEAGFGKPKNTRMGVDFAGTVEAVGKNVTRFKPGDEVYGGKFGAFGEYVSVREDRAIVAKPANITFEQAAAVPIAAITALQGLRDTGKIKAGQKVLINGASGGVGTFAVQIAKSFGAEVTGVCSTRNVEMVRSLGADHVIDYTRENFTEGKEQYDLILDNVGSQPFSAYRRVLKPDGVVVIVGSTSQGKWLGAMTSPLKGWFLSKFVSQKFLFFLADLSQQDLGVMNDLMQAGKVTPVIDRRYKLSEVPTAIGYLQEGHARAKVVITMDEAPQSPPAQAKASTETG